MGTNTMSGANDARRGRRYPMHEADETTSAQRESGEGIERKGGTGAGEKEEEAASKSNALSAKTRTLTAQKPLFHTDSHQKPMAGSKRNVGNHRPLYYYYRGAISCSSIVADVTHLLGFCSFPLSASLSVMRSSNPLSFSVCTVLLLLPVGLSASP
jgi:hypothetical protein